MGESIRALADAFGNLFKTFTDDGDETTTTMTNLANSLQTIANAITAISNAYAGAKEALNYIDRSGSFNNFGGFKGLPNPLSKPKTKKARAAGGGVMAGQAYRVGEFGPELFVPSGSG